MLSRDNRVTTGAAGQAELKALLEDMAFSVIETGQEFWLPPAAHTYLRHVHDDVTVRSIRYVPDFFAWSARFPPAWWDAKVNATPGTGNFTIEAACYDEQIARWQIHQRVVIAFRDTDGQWYANSIHRLVIVRDDSARRHAARGSMTPYLLIDKGSTMRLKAFIAVPSW